MVNKGPIRKCSNHETSLSKGNRVHGKKYHRNLDNCPKAIELNKIKKGERDDVVDNYGENSLRLKLSESEGL